MIGVFELYHSVVAARPDYSFDMYTALEHQAELWSMEELEWSKQQMRAVGVLGGLGAVDLNSDFKTAREAAFPMNLVSMGFQFDCMDAIASRKSDETAIKKAIGSTKEHLNNVIHGAVASSVLSKTLKLRDPQSTSDALRSISHGNGRSVVVDLRQQNYEGDPWSFDAGTIHEADSSETWVRVLDALREAGCSHAQLCTRLPAFPNQLISLSSLTKLDLHYSSKMVELPQSLGDLQSLTSLNLIGCRSLQELPQSCCCLKHLQYLHLCYCVSLVTLPSGLGQLTSLCELDMSKCWKLEYLPQSFSKLSRLANLSLNDCQALETLPVGFADLESLCTLNLQRCTKLTTTFPSISLVRVDDDKKKVQAVLQPVRARDSSSVNTCRCLCQ